MRLKEITPVGFPRGQATKKMYQTEKQVLERVWDMKRPRSLANLQVAFDTLWAYYAPRYNIKRQQPELVFGPGVWYNGRSLSFTRARERGQSWLITLAPGERNYYVLIHEFVHALGPNQHGLRFAQVYHDVLSHDTVIGMMSTPEGQQFMRFLSVEHPEFVKRLYRARRA